MPPQRRSSSPPPGPPELRRPSEEARAIIEQLLAEGHELLRTETLAPIAVEQFEANCRRWSTKCYEHLRRMWDQDVYATSFDWSGGYGPTSRYDTPNSRFTGAHESLRKQIHDLESQLDKIEIAAEAPPRQPTQPAGPSAPDRTTVIVRGGTGVNVTIGSQVRDISTTVQEFRGPSAEEVQELTTAFAQAIAADEAVSDEERKVRLEQLKFVADAAARPGSQSRAILGPIIDRLGLIARASGALQSIYQQWQPLITNILQQHHS